MLDSDCYQSYGVTNQFSYSPRRKLDYLTETSSLPWKSEIKMKIKLKHDKLSNKRGDTTKGAYTTDCSAKDNEVKLGHRDAPEF